jgi:hypothetical protein
VSASSGDRTKEDSPRVGACTSGVRSSRMFWGPRETRASTGCKRRGVETSTTVAGRVHGSSRARRLRRSRSAAGRSLAARWRAIWVAATNSEACAFPPAWSTWTATSAGVGRMWRVSRDGNQFEGDASDVGWAAALCVR